MSYLEELLPDFRKGAKIRRKDWRDGKYIKLSGVYAKDEYGDVYFIEPNEITADDWELYEEPINWQYIIDNKCLCWFWEDSKQDKLAQNLNSVDSNSPFMFVDSRNVAYKHCRPVRRDEVTFYEDNFINNVLP